MKYNKIQLKDGIVMMPNDFITVDATITAVANYAGVLAEKNGSLPHFVILLEKPICDLKEEEEERIFDLCAKVYPELKTVRRKEIEAKFNQAGSLVTNGDEWRKAPRLGIFEIPEVQDEKALYLGTGIIRRG